MAFAMPRPRSFSELDQLEAILKRLGGSARAEVACEIPCGSERFPVHVLTMGSDDPISPCIGFFAGVHGLERIGTRVVLSYLHTLSELIEWDATIHALLKRVRLAFMPLINPSGMFLGRRSNARRIDLMRNAPVESRESVFMIGGQRFSPALPWFRGREDDPMEPELLALIQAVRANMFASPVSIAIDVHSGFGLRDRLWFPYAKTRAPFPSLAEAFALKRLLDRTYPNHFYQMEPQSLSYATHGDVWDHLYDLHRSESDGRRMFLPLCLEMGSWTWVKKNPWQVFSASGPFNPLKKHRMQRTLRRHLILFDFLTRATISKDRWFDETDRAGLDREARSLWYGESRP